MGKVNKIGIIGSGAWGSAIANVVACNCSEIIIYSNNKDTIVEINQLHTNSKFLPNVKLEKNIRATSDITEFREVEIIFMVVPAKFFAVVCDDLVSIINAKIPIVICSKGLSSENEFLSDLLAKKMPNNSILVMSGPNFAIEVARKYNTITTIASKDKNIADFVIESTKTSFFTPYYSNDMILAEICGIFKNILAIGCGLIEGLEMGNNTKSAFLTIGIREIVKIYKIITGKNYTDIINPAGIGDIFLTCSSRMSRNMSFGFGLAVGVKDTESQTVEGVNNMELAIALIRKYEIKSDIFDFMNEVIFGDINKDIIKQKLSEILSNSYFD